MIQNQVAATKNACKKKKKKKKTKHKGENNNVVARAPPTCNPTNVREVGPQLKRLQRTWFGGEGKRA